MAVMRKVALALVLACLLALALAPGMVAAASGRKGKGGARKGASPRREVAVDSDGDLDEEGEDFEDEGRLAATARTFKVEHSTDGLTFQERGTLELRVNQLSGKTSAKMSKGQVLESASVAEFKQLAEADDFYRVRLRSNPDDDDSSYVVASVRACVLSRINFEERLVLHLDGHDNLLSFSFATPPQVGGAPCTPASVSKISGEVALKSFAKVVAPQTISGIPASATGGLSIKQGPEGTPAQAQAVTAEDEKKKDQPQQGFLQRYMWYIIPVVAFLMFSGGGEDPKARGRAPGK